jgi:hypothetical protein
MLIKTELSHLVVLVEVFVVDVDVENVVVHGLALALVDVGKVTIVQENKSHL